MTKHYPEVNSNPDFSKLEENVLKYWKENDSFKESISNRDSKKDNQDNEFVFYDGPPFANGLPHYGHLLTGFIKDIFARYQTIKGKKVERRFGWDCHGLPAEMGAEKELGISGRHKIVEYGIEEFNQQCRKSVMQFSGDWEKYVDRQARWVDFENDYKTMDTNYMESVLWAFNELYKKGLVYESMRVMPYSWACETPLSNFETKLDNSYRERADKAVTVAFELKEIPKNTPNADSYKVLAWTTTPWTLPSNLSLAVGEELDYSYIIEDKICYIIAKSSISSYAKELKINDEDELNSFKGSDLVGLKYKPLFPYFKDNANSFKIIAGDFVTDGDGTGIVHLAPGFGEDDQRVCQEAGIELVCPVDNAGKFTSGISGLAKLDTYGGDEYSASESYECYEISTNRFIFVKSYGSRFEFCSTWIELKDGDKNYLFPKNNCLNLYSKWVQKRYGEGFSSLGGEGFVDNIYDERFYSEARFKGKDGLVKKFKVQDYVTIELENYDNISIILNPIGGKNVLECNDEIIKFLKNTGSWIKTEQYIHNYPHCWRTDTPLIYKAVPSWYIEVTKFKDRMVELNQQINWIPDHIKNGQFGKWLENARDWSISRNRFWGSPIPIWRSDNPNNKELYVFGSIKELEDFFETEVTDLHRPYIDELTKPDPLDPQYTLRRVEDVFDCWFESGSMPYAQAHYPFENKDWFESHFPADFIVEYVAQTRGWFYTLMVLSTALFDRPPFLNVICHGVVLDDKGQKLSKRLNNYADPMDVFEKFGSDAMRWVMISAPIMHGGDLLIDKEGNMVRDAVRLVIKPIWNSYSFFCLYANADGVEAEFDVSSDNLMDRYILSKCKNVVSEIEKYMDAYDTPSTCKAVENFFEVLNNWYIRRNKERFWRTEKDQDKINAYNTLYSVLNVMCRAISPLLPLLTEDIWQGLRAGEKSIHLSDFPKIDDISDENNLIADMDRVRDICNAALSIRGAENIRVRQPLASLTIIDNNPERLKDYSDIIKDEMNIKEVKFSSEIDKFADLQLKINFPVLGKRLPTKMKNIISATKQGKWSKNDEGNIKVENEVLTFEECSLQLVPKDKKGAQSLSSNDALVLLDLEISEKLKIEGVARDLVRAIQQSRKDAKLDITDKINLVINTESEIIKDATNNFSDYILAQTLANSVSNDSEIDYKNSFEHKIDGIKTIINFEKVA